MSGYSLYGRWGKVVGICELHVYVTEHQHFLLKCFHLSLCCIFSPVHSPLFPIYFTWIPFSLPFHSLPLMQVIVPHSLCSIFFFRANSWSGRFLTKNFILWPLFYVWLSIFKKKKKKNLTCCHLFITIYWSLRKNSVCGCLAMSSVFWITFLDTVLFTPLNFLQIISF